MSCLNLRLPAAKKAWKNFTSKLQSRLHNLSKSKAIKKPRNRLYVTNTTAKDPFINVNKGLRFSQHRRRYLFKKKAGPVYIDKLFKGPIAAAAAAAELVTQYSPSLKNVKLLDQEARTPGTSNVNVNVNEDKACSSSAEADDMWESLALASPQMNGIDQRAEEFIKSFRAQMELQEIMARRL